MKRIKKFFLGNIKPLIAFILGLIISGTTVYAAILFASSDVSYDNTQSGLQSTNVQDALDELYDKANTLVKPKNNTVYFDYGLPTTSSTTDYTTLNKNFFLALNGDQLSLCVVYNNFLHCFDENNYLIEMEHAKAVFGDTGWGGNGTFYYKNINVGQFYIRSEGGVDIIQGSATHGCMIGSPSSSYNNRCW